MTAALLLLVACFSVVVGAGYEHLRRGGSRDLRERNRRLVRDKALLWRRVAECDCQPRLEVVR